MIARVGLIPADCLKQLIEQAENGDYRSQLAASAINGWSKWVLSTEAPPRCMVCERAFVPEAIAGFAVAVNDSDGSENAIAAGFCRDCGSKLSSDQLRYAFRAAIMRDGLGQLDPLQ